MIRFLFTFLLPVFLSADLPELKNVRQLFFEGVESESKTKILYKQLQNNKESLPPLYLGYFGATEALLAKHSWNPYTKLDYLNKGLKTIGSAIEAEPDNLELRFLRFSIQHYLPGFLGQSKELIQDRDNIIKQLLNNNYKPEDKEVVKNVAGFLLETKRCTSEQNKILKNFI